MTSRPEIQIGEASQVSARYRCDGCDGPVYSDEPIPDLLFCELCKAEYYDPEVQPKWGKR